MCIPHIVSFKLANQIFHIHSQNHFECYIFYKVNIIILSIDFFIALKLELVQFLMELH